MFGSEQAWMCRAVCTSGLPVRVVMRSGAVGEDVRFDKRPSFINDLTTITKLIQVINKGHKVVVQIPTFLVKTHHHEQQRVILISLYTPV